MMASELGCLRCSKLNCYVEFNKMVQSLAQHEDKLERRSLHGLYPPNKGTGAEYNFFRTLVLMLIQVMSNNDADGQKQELQLIYQWFCINKPLAAQQVKKSARRPKLVYSSSRQRASHTRPVTAPAALSSTRQECSHTPPPPTPTIPNFTSTYVKHCLQPRRREMSPLSEPSPGAETDSQLHPQNRAHWSTSLTREAFQHRIASGVSVVELPAPSSDRPVTAGSVFNLASSVAAEMALERIISHPRARLWQSVTTSDKPWEQPHHPAPQAEETPKVTPPLQAVEQTTSEQENKSSGERRAAQSTTDQLSSLTEGIKSDLPSQPGIYSAPTLPTVRVMERKSKEQLSGSTQSKRTACQPHMVTLTLSLSPHEGMTQHSRQQEHIRHPKALLPIVAGFTKNSYRHRPRTVN